MIIEKEDQRTMLTKRMLRDSLVALLKEKSIYKITIRELCEVAGVNRSTFYRYYENQFALLGEMETEILSLIYLNLEKLKEQEKQDNLRLLIVILSRLEEDVEFSRLLVNNNVDPEFPNKLLNSPQIKEYILVQLKHKYSVEQIDYIAYFLTYGCYRVVQIWINKKRRESVKELASMLAMFIAKVVNQ